MEEHNPNKIEEEIDFQAVAKTPIRWFGLIYPYFIVLIIFGGLYYVVNLDNVALNKIKPQYVDSTKFPKDIAAKKGVTLAGVNIAEIVKPDDKIIAKGKELFKSTCSSCHGEEGKGDGAAGASLNPKPRNFTSKDAWINGRKIADIYKTLEEGIPGSGMVAYEYLPVEDKFALIHYIQSIMPDIPQNTAEELAILDDTYSLSKGRIMPNQIPVAKALKILSKEAEPIHEANMLVASLIETHKSDPSFDVFDRVCSNKQKAINYLQKSNIWKTSNSSFANYIASNINNNGFKPLALKLNDEQINGMRSFLARFFE